MLRLLLFESVESFPWEGFPSILCFREFFVVSGSCKLTKNAVTDVLRVSQCVLCCYNQTSANIELGRLYFDMVDVSSHNKLLHVFSVSRIICRLMTYGTSEAVPHILWSGSSPFWFYCFDSVMFDKYFIIRLLEVSQGIPGRHSACGTEHVYLVSALRSLQWWIMCWQTKPLTFCWETRSRLAHITVQSRLFLSFSELQHLTVTFRFFPASCWSRRLFLIRRISIASSELIISPPGGIIVAVRNPVTDGAGSRQDWTLKVLQADAFEQLSHILAALINYPILSWAALHNNGVERYFLLYISPCAF